jgi:hypothetical protein
VQAAFFGTGIVNNHNMVNMLWDFCKHVKDVPLYFKAGNNHSKFAHQIPSSELPNLSLVVPGGGWGSSCSSR